MVITTGVRLSITEELRRYKASKSWAKNNMHLLRRYKGEFVAVIDGNVVDHDVDRGRLLSRLWVRGLYPGPVLLIRVT